jgi:hypothetical protein
MFGMLVWTIYVSIAGARATSIILRQPLCVDPTEITPFEAIGRQSFYLALVFIGGTTLSLLLSAFEPRVFRDLGFWLLYFPITLVPIAIFFWAMLPTHRVLANAKANELLVVRRELRQASMQLLGRTQSPVANGAAQEIRALAVLEQRLQLARTWPYNTSMLRTLFVSVLVPGGLLLIRTLIDRYIQ